MSWPCEQLTKELSRQLTHLTILIHYIAAEVNGAHPHLHLMVLHISSSHHKTANHLPLNNQALAICMFE
jgi:hypothetical protein